MFMTYKYEREGFDYSGLKCEKTRFVSQVIN
jgi:hypothetical protein